MQLTIPYISIPRYNLDTKEWNSQEFSTKQEYREYVDSHFKTVGNYNLKYAQGIWNEKAKYFQDKGYYCNFIAKTRDHKAYWDLEKDKCRFDGAVIYHSPSEGLEYCVPGLYYWYLNFTPINDKIKRKLDFPDIWDSDYHYFLYILRCVLHGKHAVILKKRQWGASLKNTAILLNNTWFGKAQKNKIFAEDKTHVENSWSFMEDYRDHINTHCGWTRKFQPDSLLNWQQRWKTDQNTFVGNKSILKGLSTEKDPSKPVGGGISVLFGEEAGINASLDITHSYALPAVTFGAVTSGIIIYSGSVGELSKCEPLKKFMYEPDAHGFLGVQNDTDEDLGAKEIGFFAPEWWNYVSVDEHGDPMRCFDSEGNTNREFAIQELLKQREKAKKADPETYRYFCSQRPLSLGEAFQFRKESIFPTALIQRQIGRIDQDKALGHVVRLHRDEHNQIKHRVIPHNESKVIYKFPLSKDTVDKEGDIVVWEFPPDNPQWGVYYAGIDPVNEGKTTESPSLFNIYIYKSLVHNKTKDSEGKEMTQIDGDKIVAVWTGRFDDVNKTNERASLMVEWFNAYTVCENNVTSFIQHMIRNKKQKYLAKKSDLPFLKEIQANKSVYQEYGVKMTVVVKNYIISQMIEYLKEEIGAVHTDAGKTVKTIYGVERIPDKMLLAEMLEYHDKLNVDRIIGFGLVLAFAKSRQTSGLIPTQTEAKEVEDMSVYSYTKQAFRSIGKSPGDFSSQMLPKRDAFRNLK